MSQKSPDAIALSHQLQRIMALDCPVEEKVEQALDAGAEYLNVETGLAVKTLDDDAVWEAIVSTAPDDSRFSAGATLDLSKTYCRHVTDREASLTVHDATADRLGDDPAHQEFGVETYFGTPLYQGEDVFGTVCFISQQSQTALNIDESLVLELIGRFTQAVLVEADYEADLENTTELLSVLTRVFRHNIRNKLTIIRGYLERYPEQSEIEVGTPLDAADEIIELSEMAREIEKVVQATSDQRDINLTNTIKTVCNTVKDSFPASSITVDAPDTLDYYARPTLELALEEVIENAVKHTDGDAEVSVQVTEADNEIEIEIQDSGSGLPKQEQAVLEDGTETPLVHSSGLGLWLAHTIVTNHGGTITTNATAVGTTVTFTLPRTPIEVRSSLGEEDLQQEYDKFKRIFDEAIAPIVIVDDHAHVLEANERAAELVDQPQKELLGRDIEEFMTTDSAHETLEDLIKDVPETVEIVDSKGTTYLVEYSITRDFEPGQHLIVGQDVTKQRNRKRELEKIRQRMSFALSMTDAVVWDWNIATDEVTYYPSEETVFGTTINTREEFMEVVHPADRQRVADTLEQALQAGEIKREEARIVVDGETRWIDAPGKPIIEDGTPRRMVGLVRDITDRKERSAELERTQELLQRTEQLADTGGWEIDPETREVFWTENLFEILGVEGDEEPPLEEALALYHEADRPQVAKTVESALESGESFDIEARIQRPDGEERMLRVKGSPTVVNGEVVQLRGAVRVVRE